MFRSFMAGLGLVFCVGANADVIGLKPGPSEIEGVNVSVGAVVNLDGRTYTLTTTGAGLRRSKVWGPVALKVYVGQILLADPSRFSKSVDGALPSMEHQDQVVMRMTFLRDLESKRMVTSFEDSLAANGMNDSDPDIARFVQMIRATGDIDAESSISIFIARNGNGSETLIYEVSGRRSFNDRHVAAAGFIKKIASLWLGRPSDEGLAEFKGELLR